MIGATARPPTDSNAPSKSAPVGEAAPRADETPEVIVIFTVLVLLELVFGLLEASTAPVIVA